MSAAFLLCMGFIVGITDGDTLRVKCDAPNLGEIKVRLAEIDAPEKKQPYGQRAKVALSDLAFGKMAKIIQTDTDRYARVVARVEPAGDAEVNFALVRQGFAWCYTKYIERPDECHAAENEARSNHRGLWADTGAIAPWEWRHTRKEEAKAKPAG